MADGLISLNIEAAGKREEAENEGAQYLAVDAIVKYSKRHLSEIKDASDMLRSSVTEQDQTLLKSVVKKLYGQLRESTTRQSE